MNLVELGLVIDHPLPVEQRHGLGGHSASPSRSHVSPRGAPRSPVRDVPADSTIPDGALNTMQPPPQPFSASKLNSVATNSPQRISLDERLEKELGIKEGDRILLTLIYNCTTFHRYFLYICGT